MDISFNVLQHRMKMAHSWLLVSIYLILLVGLIACESSTRIVVTDFNHTLKLENKNSRSRIVRLRLRIKSNIDYPISMDLKNGEQFVQRIHVKENDITTLFIDWYTNHAEVSFKSVINKGKSIEIEYEFVEL